MTEPSSDTFVLYRILGNSLPPRHRRGEVVENLRFTLQHEGPLERCDKRWVLNRIADQGVEQECLALIEAAGHHTIRIPFELDAYARCFVDGSDMPEALLQRRLPPGARVSPAAEAYAMEWRLRRKSLYAISLNLARNLAISEGQGLARWTLPFDGSCFFTPRAWRDLLELAAASEQELHLIVPLARVASNQVLLDPDFAPVQAMEPQIAFRHDSRARFDEQLRYGNMNKAELLRILGVPGPWQEWPMTPWEGRADRVSPERGRFARGAWVARLQATGDREVEALESTRWKSRFLGVEALCAQLDTRVVQRALAGHPLFWYGRESLEAARGPQGDAVRAELVRRARQALGSSVATVLDKSIVPASGDKHDYMSAAPYFHAVGDAVVHRDGFRVPEASLFGEASKKYDRTALESVISRAAVAALAGATTGESRYFADVAKIARIWFIDRETRMNPHMRYAQVLPGGPGFGQIWGIVDFRNLPALLDAVTLSFESGALTADELASIREWFGAFLDDVVTRDISALENNVGVWGDVLVASIAAFVGKPDIAARTLADAPLRIVGQLAPFSVPRMEVSRAAPLHYCLFHLQAWICLAWLGRSLGVDLWKYSASFRRSIAMEAQFIALNRSSFTDYADRPGIHDQRIAAAVRCIPADAADHQHVAALGLPTGAPFVDDPDFGMPPCWPALRVP